MSVPLKKTRKPNWGEEEMKILSEAVLEHHGVLFGKFSPSLTAEMKRAAWENICTKVNAVSISCKRTVDEIKKRWKDAKGIVKKKEAHRKNEMTVTGGGPSSDVTFKAWELDVLSTIPAESIIGLEGAIDTSVKKENTSLKALSMPEATDASGDASQHSSEMNQEEEHKLTTTIEEVIISPDDITDNRTPEKHKPGKIRRSGKKDEDALIFDDLIVIKKMRLDIEERRLKVEERKAAALERIATVLEMKNYNNLSLSPIIKF